jgi:hypothetical protein
LLLPLFIVCVWSLSLYLNAVCFVENENIFFSLAQLETIRTIDHYTRGEHVNQYTSDTHTNTYTLLSTTAIIGSSTVKEQFLIYNWLIGVATYLFTNCCTIYHIKLYFLIFCALGWYMLVKQKVNHTKGDAVIKVSTLTNIPLIQIQIHIHYYQRRPL